MVNRINRILSSVKSVENRTRIRLFRLPPETTTRNSISDFSCLEFKETHRQVDNKDKTQYSTQDSSMEDESQEILLSSLENFGVSIPENVSSVKDLNPATLVSICGQCLNRIDGTASFCTSLPDSMAEKFRICTELSSAVEKLGYIGDMSYYKVKRRNFIGLCD